MIVKVKKLYEENPKELIFRVLSFLLSALILPNIVTLMFIIYMSNSGFFSYDFFTDGVFGMKLFFLVSIVFFIIFALLLSGSIIFIIKDIKDKKLYGEIFKRYCLLIIINIWVFAMMILLTMEERIQWEWTFYLSIMSILLCVHIAIVVTFDAKKQFGSLIFVVFIAFIFSINFSDMTAKFISMGLKKFSIGGNVKAEVYTKNSDSSKGLLVLMTPKFIFFKPENNKGVRVYPISSIEYMYIGEDIAQSE